MEKLVVIYDAIIPTINLPDPDDCHVLAAAIKVNANIIVTLNLRDFPAEVLKPHSIEAIHPDQFTQALIKEQPSIVFRVLKEARMGLKRPPLTAEEYIQTLAKHALPLTTKLLYEYRDWI